MPDPDTQPGDESRSEPRKDVSPTDSVSVLLTILVLAFLHFGALWASFWTTHPGQWFLYTGGLEKTALHDLAYLLTIILSFPFGVAVFALPQSVVSGTVFFVCFAFNSLAWGTGLYFLGESIRRRWVN